MAVYQCRGSVLSLLNRLGSGDSERFESLRSSLYGVGSWTLPFTRNSWNGIDYSFLQIGVTVQVWCAIVGLLSCMFRGIPRSICPTSLIHIDVVRDYCTNQDSPSDYLPPSATQSTRDEGMNERLLILGPDTFCFARQ